MLKIKNLIIRDLKLIYLFYLIFFISISSVFGQSTIVEEWEQKLSKAEGQDRIDLILEITEELQYEDLTMADSLAREGIRLANELGDSLSIYRAGALLGNVYRLRHEVAKGMEWIRKSLNHYERNESLAFDKAKLLLDLAECYMRIRNIGPVDSLISESDAYFKHTDDLYWKNEVLHHTGRMYFHKKDYEQAEYHYNEVLKVSRPQGFTGQTVKALNNISLIKEYQGHFAEAIELQFQILEMDCNSYVKAYAYNNIGRTYRVLKDWEPAKKYNKMSIELKKKIGMERAIHSNLTTMGVIHQHQMNYGEALKYYEQSLAIKQKNGMYTGDLLGVMGGAYYMAGQHVKAEEYFNQFIAQSETQGNWQAKVYVHSIKGGILYEEKKYEEALKYLLAAYNLAEENNGLRHLMGINEALVDVYKNLGQEKEAKYHKDLNKMIEDSLYSPRQLKKIGALEQKHYTKLQADSLGSADQENVTAGKEQGSWLTSNALPALALLVFILTFAFLVFKKYYKPAAPPSTKEPLDQTKIDQYFAELFARLDANKNAGEAKTNRKIVPIDDMAEFLKSNLSASGDWASFEHYFEKVHKDFFKSLKSDFPTITVNELNMCALLKLNLLNKDIAQIMGISPDSVRKAQNRLSKKMELSPNEALRDVVLKI
ncbi:MAG: tetratricopeptide repeat protein [Bacteroidota bacterium]